MEELYCYMRVDKVIMKVTKTIPLLEEVQIFSIDFFVDTLARLAEYQPPRVIEPWAINFEDRSLFCATED